MQTRFQMQYMYIQNKALLRSTMEPWTHLGIEIGPLLDALWRLPRRCLRLWLRIHGQRRPDSSHGRAEGPRRGFLPPLPGRPGPPLRCACAGALVPWLSAQALAVSGGAAAAAGAGARAGDRRRRRVPALAGAALAAGASRAAVPLRAVPTLRNRTGTALGQGITLPPHARV